MGVIRHTKEIKVSSYFEESISCRISDFDFYNVHPGARDRIVFDKVNEEDLINHLGKNKYTFVQYDNFIYLEYKITKDFSYYYGIYDGRILFNGGMTVVGEDIKERIFVPMNMVQDANKMIENGFECQVGKKYALNVTGADFVEYLSKISSIDVQHVQDNRYRVTEDTRTKAPNGMNNFVEYTIIFAQEDEIAYITYSDVEHKELYV